MTDTLSLFVLDRVQVRKQDKTILDGIDWSVPTGHTSVIMGPSGSGKTSLLRLLNRLDDPAAGRLMYDDMPITSWAIPRLRREIGMVFQRPELFEGTVEDNLMFGPSIHGVCVEPEELMSLVGLESGILDQDVRTLSGGQAQRVSIGRAVAVGPRVLLLDEPTSGLDPAATGRIEALVGRLVTKLGLTCVFVTHDIAQAGRVGDRVLVLVDGHKVEEGPMSDVLTNPRDHRTLAFLKGEVT